MPGGGFPCGVLAVTAFSVSHPSLSEFLAHPGFEQTGQSSAVSHARKG